MSPSCRAPLYYWGDYTGWRRNGAGRLAAVVCVRRPPDVPARRGGAHQGLGPSRRHPAPRATSTLDPMAGRAVDLPGHRGARQRDCNGRDHRLNAPGGFDFAFKLPENRQPGPRQVHSRRGRQRPRARSPRLPDPGVPPPRVRGDRRARARARTSSAARDRRRQRRRYYRRRRAARRRRAWTWRRADQLHARRTADDFVFGPGAVVAALVVAPRARARRTWRRRDVRRRDRPQGIHRLRLDFRRSSRRAHERRAERARSRTSTGRRGPAAPTLLVHPSDALRRHAPREEFVEEGSPSTST